MQKVVVTGALGFIGFALVERLLEGGYEVIGIDGMIDPRLHDLYEEKKLMVGRNAQLTLIEKRVEDIDLKQVFKGVDVVYHLAAATSRDRNWEVLRTTIEDNVGVTEKVVSACNEKTKIIFTSSTQVYGERSGIVTEKTPLNPITPYSLTKMAAESIIRTRSKELNIPYVIFRLPTIYGPWQRSDMTYHTLIMEKETKDSKEFANGEIDFDRVTEDVLYISDILDTLIEAGVKVDCKNEIYNLSTGKVNEWYQGLEKIYKGPLARKRDEKLEVSISNAKVSSHLGFNMTTNLELGLQKQIDHVKKFRHVYNRLLS